MALTDIKIKTAKPKDKPYKLADGEGMYLLVNINGSKYWRMKYRIAGKEKILSIGVYPDISLADARAKRTEARKILASGGDPSEAKKEEKLALQISLENTFEALAREWHSSKSDRWSLRYRDEIIDTFEKDIFPHIGKRPIADIKPMEVVETLRKIEKRGALEKMCKVRQRCKEVFSYAIVTGRADANPAADLASALATPVMLPTY